MTTAADNLDESIKSKKKIFLEEEERENGEKFFPSNV